jgi:hypothetical protein
MSGQPTPAERWAFLKALAAAFAVMARDAEADVRDVIAATSAKSFETRFGSVTVAKTGWAVKVADPEALAATLPPDQVMAVPKPWAEKQALARIVVVAGQAVDRDTGELAGWAAAEPTGGHLLWPASDVQREAKAAALAAAASGLAALEAAPAVAQLGGL